MKKIFGYKSITHLLYGLLLLLPFLAILGRSVYTIANKNANQSYYGETINEYNNVFTDDLINGETYYLQTPTQLEQFNVNGSAQTCIISVSDVEDLSNSSYDFDNVTRIGFYSVTDSTNFRVYFFKGSNTNESFNFTNSSTIELKFTVVGTTQLFDTYIENNSIFYKRNYNKYSYLDNAFEYSLSTFIEDNQLGNVDFFSWFTNIFLNQTSPHNALYLNFANWYLNYIMLVSCGYLLFLVLLWFVNYSRSLLERGMNRNNGGF